MTFKQAESLDELNRMATQNSVVSGLGLGVEMSVPCAFCGAPGLMKYKLLSMREGTHDKPFECSECHRSMKIVYHDILGGGVRFEMFQCGGPDQPEWLVPKMRRVPT